MNFTFTPEIIKKIQIIKKKDPLLFRKIQKQLTLFNISSSHPSLRTHRLQGNLQDYWSISIDRSIRMVYYTAVIENGDVAVFFKIGKHEEVYRK